RGMVIRICNFQFFQPEADYPSGEIFKWEREKKSYPVNVSGVGWKVSLCEASEAEAIQTYSGPTHTAFREGQGSRKQASRYIRFGNIRS
ncbi:MAG TPA: hypothetical protein VN420_05745, partial [Candidatus Fimivivens sp.]|nr:hypothetical protein [Candidatus Fimivivens sp.]